MDKIYKATGRKDRDQKWKEVILELKEIDFNENGALKRPIAEVQLIILKISELFKFLFKEEKPNVEEGWSYFHFFGPYTAILFPNSLTLAILLFLNVLLTN